MRSRLSSRKMSKPRQFPGLVLAPLTGLLLPLPTGVFPLRGFTVFPLFLFVQQRGRLVGTRAHSCPLPPRPEWAGHDGLRETGLWRICWGRPGGTTTVSELNVEAFGRPGYRCAGSDNGTVSDLGVCWESRPPETPPPAAFVPGKPGRLPEAQLHLLPVAIGSDSRGRCRTHRRVWEAGWL